jgi:hypothetical protein
MKNILFDPRELQFAFLICFVVGLVLGFWLHG